jgi:FtsP/CotA-like multicopper oxidase with cupredoxin domain
VRNQLVATKELLVPPAARYEVLLRGARPGRYKLIARRFSTGPAGDHYPPRLLATVASSGAQAAEIPLPTSFPPVPDLRERRIDARRQIDFADQGDDFTINGQTYDHDRIDTTVPLGNVEEWTIRNTSCSTPIRG